MKSEIQETVNKVVTEMIGDEYLTQVRTFGALGYTPERICRLLKLNKKDAVSLRLRIGIVGDAYNDAYQQGRYLGEYNIDAELAKKAEKGDVEAVVMLEERKHDRQVKDLRFKLFGI